MKFLNSGILLFFIIFSFSVLAGQYQSGLYKRYILTSDTVARVSVSEAKNIKFTFDGVSHSCGTNYKAELVTLYQGKSLSSNIEFSSSFPLMVSEEYVLFLGRVKPEDSLSMEWSDKKYGLAYAECEQNLYITKLNEHDFSLIWNRPYDLSGKWVVFGDMIHSSNDTSYKEMNCFLEKRSCSFLKLKDFEKIFQD